MASANAIVCVDIIQNVSSSQRKKIEQLKRIFSRDLDCLLEHVPLADGREGTVLHAAVSTGHTNVVGLLLKQGADVHSKDSIGQLPIFAAFNHDFPESFQIMKLLIKFGADVNVLDVHGRPPLTSSIHRECDTKIIELLLKNGANVSCSNVFSFLRFKKLRIERLLIKHLILHCPDTLKPSFFSRFCRSSSYWDKCKIRVNNELSKMKEMNLGKSAISAHDILVADDKILVHYMRNEAVQEFLSSRYKTLFPMYACMIKKQIQKGMARRTLENLGHIIMNHWRPSLIDQSARQQIFDHLEMQDLRNLRKSALLSFSYCWCRTNHN